MNNEQSKILNITPIKKGKRMLIFLGDFFLMFIIGFVLMNMMVVPIMNRVVHLQERQNDDVISERACLDVLYGNNLLCYENDAVKYDLDYSLDYSSICFLSYYVLDNEISLDSTPRYGHINLNEFFYHYYLDIKNDLATYINTFKQVDSSNHYFIFTESEITLNDEYKTLLNPYFDSKDNLSEKGTQVFNDITENYYLNLYSKVIEDIQANDLVYESISFKENNQIVVEFNEFFAKFFSICSSISYVLSWAICYILIPLVNKNHKTLTMLILKIERIGLNNLYLLKSGETILYSIYQLALSLFFIGLLPLSYIPITYAFSLPWTPALMSVGLVFDIASFFVILFNQYNQGLSDLLSRSVLISKDDLDAIYRSKGYIS